MPFMDIVVLYLLFRVKQLLCDFILQTSWMATQKGREIRPLLSHAGIHAVGTLLVVLLCAPWFWWLAAVDFLVHGAIDRFKVHYTDKKGWTYKDKYYWWAFGLDQEAHNLTHLGYIILIAMGAGAGGA